MLNFVLSNKIKSIAIDVSEEIDNKNIKKFIFTSLKLNKHNINKDDLFH